MKEPDTSDDLRNDKRLLVSRGYLVFPGKLGSGRYCKVLKAEDSWRRNNIGPDAKVPYSCNVSWYLCADRSTHCGTNRLAGVFPFDAAPG